MPSFKDDALLVETSADAAQISAVRTSERPWHRSWLRVHHEDDVPEVPTLLDWSTLLIFFDTWSRPENSYPLVI